MRVRFTPEALLAVREKRAWWQDHRKEAPRMFAEELGVIVGKLRDGKTAERQKYAARGELCGTVCGSIATGAQQFCRSFVLMTPRREEGRLDVGA